MVLQCKKGKHFATGEVFPLDIGLLMGVVLCNEKGKLLIVGFLQNVTLFG